MMVTGIVAGQEPPLPDQQGQAKKIQAAVTVDDNGQPVVTPDSIYAREGDEVHWVFKGNPAKDFIVTFTGAEGSPFDWETKKGENGASVTGTVKAGAAKGGKRTRYKYAVDVGGKVLDPMIIIDN
jgi:plastocyanin